MKKIYKKPEIFFENFSLSTNIATCDEPFTHAQNVCGIPDITGQDTVFTLDIGDCTVSGNGTEMNDGFCYHVPTPGYQLFSS